MTSHYFKYIKNIDTLVVREDWYKWFVGTIDNLMAMSHLANVKRRCCVLLTDV